MSVPDAVDSIHHDREGRIQYHYTIIDVRLSSPLRVFVHILCGYEPHVLKAALECSPEGPSLREGICTVIDCCQEKQTKRLQLICSLRPCLRIHRQSQKLQTTLTKSFGHRYPICRQCKVAILALKDCAYGHALMK